MSSLSLHATASLQATMSPRLQRAVRLLQMSSQDFAQVVRDALDTNPFLEQEEGGPAPGEPASEPPADANHGAYENWGVDGGSRLRYSNGDGNVFDALAQGTSLATHLHGQIERAAAARARPRAGRGDRRCRSTTTATCARRSTIWREGLDLSPEPEPDELQIALRRVQSLDPPGVGARNVAECLRAAAAGDRRRAGERELARRDHRAITSTRSPHGHARAGAPLGSRTPAEIEAACAAHPPPRPAAGLALRPPRAVRHARRHRARRCAAAGPAT